MFIEAPWSDSVLALLLTINALYGAPERVAVKHTLSCADVAVIAGSLAKRTYRPEAWFDKGPGVATALPSSGQPVPSPSSRHDVVLLNIEPSGFELVSSRSGLVFDDPFYAVLAGYNVGLNERRLVELRVSSPAQAWSQRARIIGELRGNAYAPEHYFGPGGAVYTGAAGAQLFEIGSLSSDDLARLVRSGDDVVDAARHGPQVYRLYHYVPPEQGR